MKVYFQGTQKNKEILGSFGVCILDSRKNIDNLISDGFELFEIKKTIDRLTGFRIIRSARFIDSDINKSKTIYNYREK